MCKKDILNQLKNLSKSIPSNLNLNTIKNTTAQQLKKATQKVDMKQIYKKTAQQLNSKQQTLNQYANKAKQIIQQNTDNLVKNSQKIINATSQYKNKILDQKNINKQKQNLQEFGEKLKQNVEYGQKVVEQKAQDLVKSAKQYKQKLVNSNNSPKPKKYSVYGISQSLLKRNKKFNILSTLSTLTQHPQKFVKSILSGMYWRILFALCLIGFIYISPQLLKHGGELWLKHKALQQQKAKNKQADAK